jgi:hypothetical protein
MNDLSCFSWEPCILKHPPYYDDPWRYATKEKDTVRLPNYILKRKEVLVYDCHTFQITDHPSIRAASQFCGIKRPTHLRESVKRGAKIIGRYLAGMTIQELFDNMAKHGLT